MHVYKYFVKSRRNRLAGDSNCIFLWHKSEDINKQKIVTSEISGDSSFATYAWLCALALFHRLHSKIAMANEVVPYYTITALVPTLKKPCCSCEVTLLLSWSTHTATLLEYLRGYSNVA